MPQSAKKEPSSEDPAEELTFEDAFEKLESVVQEMESEQVSLEQLIENYEAGTRWFQICQQRLEEAHDRIEVIRKKADGEITVEPFDTPAASNAAEPETPAGEPVEADKSSLKQDGELF